ncbi:MAG: hypothetical protein GX275_02940 [Clostridiales bacterium]|nr:hypothetical protein [Clostridiales bacterium]
MKKVKKISSIILLILFVFNLTTNLSIKARASEIENYGLGFVGRSTAKLQEIFEERPTTIETWVKLNKSTGRQIILGSYGHSPVDEGCFSLELTANGEPRYYELTNGNAISFVASGNDIRTEEWTHIALVKDYIANKMYWYINGEVKATYDNAGLKTAPTASQIIGSDYRNTFYLKGQLKDLRLWNYPLSKDEINKYMNSEVSGSEEGLSHAWPMNEKSGYVIKDIAGTCNGVLNGTTWSEERIYTNNGIDFSGRDVFLTFDKKFEKTPNTFEAWVKIPSNIPDSTRVGVILGDYGNCSYGDQSSINFEVYSNGNPRLYWKDKSGEKSYVFKHIDLRNDKWTHLALVRDTTTKKVNCYINGEFIETIDLGVTNDIIPEAIHKIGSDFRYTSAPVFRGEIADVAVYSSSKTVEEIKNDMVEIKNSENLLAGVTLDKDSANKYTDISSNNNNLSTYEKWLSSDKVNVYDGSYSFVAIPDTQVLSRIYPEALTSLTNWIKDNADKKNIKFAMHLGDLTDTNTDLEWQRISSSLSTLDGIVPYSIVPGNHDYNSLKSNRNSTRFNQYFSYDKYKNTESFAGAYEEGKMDNTYHKFTVGDTKYLVFSLEFGPRDGVLDWANKITYENPEYKVIVTTHGYLYHNGKHIATGDEATPSAYFSTGMDCNDGDDIWDKFISRHENILMTISGHIISEDLKMTIDTGNNGNKVYQILCDGQGVDGQEKGAGLVMIMNFSEDGKNVGINYYSPYKDAYLNTQNQFNFEVDTTINDEDIKDLEILDFSHNKDSINLGESVELKGDAIGKGMINYRFVAVSGDHKEVIQDFNINNKVTWNPKKSGKYNLYLVAKDKTGKTVQKVIKKYFVNGDPLTMTSFSINKESTKVGEGVYLTSSLIGTGTTKYRFVAVSGNYKEVIQDFDVNGQVLWVPSKAGTYNIYAVGIDDYGKKIQKIIKKYIVKERENILINNISFNKNNDEVTITVDAYGSNLQYQYFALDESYNLSMIKDYSSENTALWIPKEDSIYIIWVHIKDSNGNLEFSSVKY